MILRVCKITVILISFIFLNGFIPLLSLLGPSLTAVTSGNIYKAGIQYTLNKTIKEKTGKNSLEFVKQEITKNNKSNINDELRLLVEKRILQARKKLNLNNINQ
tara:strand:+ start:299 stop:610 length:312 start_codon:yes stop_codon:yes gene_type:complete